MIENYSAKMNEIITIQDKEGNRYDYDPSTGLISLNDVVMSGADYEPVFINSTTSDDIPPIFSGILIKKSGKVIGLNGKINTVKRNG